MLNNIHLHKARNCDTSMCSKTFLTLENFFNFLLLFRIKLLRSYLGLKAFKTQFLENSVLVIESYWSKMSLRKKKFLNGYRFVKDLWRKPAKWTPNGYCIKYHPLSGEEAKRRARDLQQCARVRAFSLCAGAREVCPRAVQYAVFFDWNGVVFWSGVHKMHTTFLSVQEFVLKKFALHARTVWTFLF